MEEYDDLSAGPTEDGKLDLSHNTWSVFPPDLGQFSKTLLHLDMKNNRLTQIPECISCLALLKTLDVSLNRIEYIDKGIGQCIRLRSINVSRNRLVSLPGQLSNCVMLEEIIADQNRLTSLPETLTNLIAISIIDVRHNQLKSIPLGLCRVPTLKSLLCQGNDDLIIAPEIMRDSTDLLFHCLEMQLKLKEIITTKSDQRDSLLIKADELQEEIDMANLCLGELEKNIATLVWERPDNYIRRRARAVELVKVVSDKIAVRKFWNNQRTHPDPEY